MARCSGVIQSRTITIRTAKACTACAEMHGEPKRGFASVAGSVGCASRAVGHSVLMAGSSEVGLLESLSFRLLAMARDRLGIFQLGQAPVQCFLDSTAKRGRCRGAILFVVRS